MKHASTSRKSGTDVKRLKSTKDNDIIIDKDSPEWTLDMFARAIVRKGLKQNRAERFESCRSINDHLRPM